MDHKTQANAAARSKSEEGNKLQSLAERERVTLLKAACRAAAAIERARRQNGLPPSVPAPWPKSTVDFLRKHAANARRDNPS